MILLIIMIFLIIMILLIMAMKKRTVLTWQTKGPASVVLNPSSLKLFSPPRPSVTENLLHLRFQHRYLARGTTEKTSKQTSQRSSESEEFMVPFHRDSCAKAVGVRIKEQSLSRDSLTVLFSVAEQPIALIPSWQVYYSTTKPRQGKDFHFHFLISPSPTTKEIVHCTSS